jgi:hypothetical protein
MDKFMHIRLDAPTRERVFTAHSQLEKEFGATLTMKQFLLHLIERYMKGKE